MALAILFWVVFVVIFLMDGYRADWSPKAWNWPFYILIALLGWGIFGPLLKG